MKIAIVSHFSTTIQRVTDLVVVGQCNQITWIASDGREAVKRCAQDIPDLLIMDLVMPVMDGVTATRLIMQGHPCAILILTTSINSYPETVKAAIKAGAVDVLDTPDTTGTNSKIILNRINAIGRLVAQKKDLFHNSISGKLPSHTPQADNQHAAPKGESVKSVKSVKSYIPILPTAITSVPSCLIAIGASTGGPGAVLGILQQLPANFFAPIVVVQHVEDEFIPSLTTWFDTQVSLTAKMAQEGDCPQIGQVLIAGGTRHLVLSRNQTLRYTDQANTIYRPSIDLFFTSLVEHWPGKIIGVLLTGIGWDGAKGLKQLRTAGHMTIAQNEKSSVVYGMPKAAAELDAAEYILAPDQIGLMLKQLQQRTHPNRSCCSD